MRRDIMNIFGAEAVFKKKETLDSETLTPIRGSEKTIKCHIYGKEIFDRGSNSSVTALAQCYLIDGDVVKENNIEVNDELDGQPIKELIKYTIPSGRIRKFERVVYEAYTYKG